MGSALSDLEIALSLPLGQDEGVLALRELVPKPLAPVEALESVLLEALQRPPCVVSFSGGRDSSGLLATACALARREGLPLPVAATLVFPGDAAAEEGEWQEVVLREVQVEQWERIVVTPGQLDAVGPVATALLRRHGLLWPFNTHFHMPIVERAIGGTVVTGFAGDEVARASAFARAERIMCRRERAGLADSLKICGLALAPRPVRAVVHRRRQGEPVPWLGPEGKRQARERLALDDADVPFGFDHRLGWFWRSRYVQRCLAAFGRMGSTSSVRFVHPFASPPLLAALARRGGVPGLGDRSEIVRLLFGGVLPPKALTRVSKAHFTTPLWTGTAKRFAAEWSGGGFDPQLVDPRLLRSHWLGQQPDLTSTTLLQAAWLYDDRGVVDGDG